MKRRSRAKTRKASDWKREEGGKKPKEQQTMVSCGTQTPLSWRRRNLWYLSSSHYVTKIKDPNSAWRHERQFAQSIDFLAGKKQDKCGNRAYTLVERVIYFSNNWDIDFGGWRMREIRHPRELILACQGEESPMGAEYFFGENVMIWLSISFPFVNHALFNLDDILLPLLALRETEKGMACMARPNQKFLRYY